MTAFRPQRRPLAVVMLLSLLGALACATLAPGTPTSVGAATPAGAATSPAGTQVFPKTSPVPPTAVPTLAVAATQPIVFGSGPLIFTNTIAGLAQLTSYTATLTYAFDGTRDGKPEKWSKTYVMLTTKTPATRQLTITTAGSVPAAGAVLMAEANGAAYEKHGIEACTANALPKGQSLADWLEPAGILSSVIGADKAGSETVNGLAADHYTFDERALGAAGAAQATGALWLASPGGYLVKYVLTTKGDADTFGAGLAGTLTWDYELTGVNQPVALQLPADCPAGLIDAPLLPDAANVRQLPGLLTYDTATSLADAAAFYEQQLPGLGWTVLDDPVTTDSSVFVDYTQGEQTLTVVITAGAGGTNVDIDLDKTVQP